MATNLSGEKPILHINSITHEGKVVVFNTHSDGAISYTVKQDGFEDSYLHTAPDMRTGWENLKFLEFPDEKDDQSVLDKEKADFTYADGPNKGSYILKSLYKTKTSTALAPVHAISALGHVYVFRQSKNNTLLVDRFLLDGMTNDLNRKLDVRFKRSRQKYAAQKMVKGANGLTNTDSLDFRDIDNNFFYEPTTELCVVDNLEHGWFSVVLVPTVESDVYRWHIFAYNKTTKKVEITTLRASEEGLFEVKDYLVFEEGKNGLVPRQIQGVIKRALEIKHNGQNVAITNGLAAAKYDLQQEQQTQSGEKQLIKTATRLLLTIPTDHGAAAISFSIAGDGTLSQINETPELLPIRNEQREVLLPLDTLDDIKAFADSTPPPGGKIKGLSVGTKEDKAEDLVKIKTDTIGDLNTYDTVQMTGTKDLQGLYTMEKVDADNFKIKLEPTEDNLGYWEKEEEESGLVFDGMISAYEITANGYLLVTCKNHGLNTNDSVQIVGTESYNDAYPVRKINNQQFVVERKWGTPEAVNVKLISQKRRGIMFDGATSYIEIPKHKNPTTAITVSAWVKSATPLWSADACLVCKRDAYILKPLQGTTEIGFNVFLGNNWEYIGFKMTEDITQWHHYAGTFDGQQIRLYVDGKEVASPHSSGKIKDQNSILTIGKDTAFERYFNGQIAEVCIWDHALTASYIKNNMYLQLRGTELGLQGYWRLGAIYDNKVFDFSENGNDGEVHENAYVGATTLKRNLLSNAPAVKYSNADLFAVSQRATYQESFEFKVNGMVNVNNADGQSNKIFTLSYWGKTSRGADERIPVPASSPQNDFKDLGGGWWQASANVTIPEGISMLRSFEVSNVKGDWESIEIRKHRIVLMSNSITQAQYTDSMSLSFIADEQKDAADIVAQVNAKEAEEARLLTEKKELDADIAALNDSNISAAITKKQAEITEMNEEIARLNREISKADTNYKNEQNNPLNYWCKLVCRENENWIARVYTQSKDLIHAEIGANGDPYYTNNTFKFVAAGGGYYKIVTMYENRELYATSKSKVWSGTGNDDKYYWRPEKFSGDYYLIRQKGTDQVLDRKNKTKFDVCIWPQHGGNNQQWKIIRIGDETNSNISNALSILTNLRKDLDNANEQLKKLKRELANLDGDESQREKRKNDLIERRDKVITLIRDIETEINKLNSDFLKSVNNGKPYTMFEVGKDSRGLVTQGALLGFIHAASRLNAIETCEGNVQISYFDKRGRMRQTNYDATADGNNAGFEQWIPDGERACLNLTRATTCPQLDKSLPLPADWSIEAWFSYPLPDNNFNALTQASNNDYHVMVGERKKLGIYFDKGLINNEKFFDCGFDMDSLAHGWHHIAAVGKGDTTLFYINGSKVGDVKDKYLKEAEDHVKNKPNDAATKKRLEDVKNTRFTTNTDVKYLGNHTPQLFGKLAELRIWEMALTDDEIAVNSKTMLSGNEPGLAAYFPFDEAKGTQLLDKTGKNKTIDYAAAVWSACSAPFGNIGGHRVLSFNGVDNYIEVPKHKNPTKAITVSAWAKSGTNVWNDNGSLICKRNAYILYPVEGKKEIKFYIFSGDWIIITFDMKDVDITQWHYYVGTYDGEKMSLYVDGKACATLNTTGSINDQNTVMTIGGDPGFNRYFNGQITEVCIWDKARTAEEVKKDMNWKMTGKEAGLVAYYPLDDAKIEDKEPKALDLAGGKHGIIKGARLLLDNTLPMVGDALISNEYSTIILDAKTGAKAAIMRRFFGYPSLNGVSLLPNKRIEELDLKWIGNAQFAPTLLGFIEGAPPVPSENLTEDDDYNGATSIELGVSEDVMFSWTRTQDSGLGSSTEAFGGADAELEAGVIISSKIAKARLGAKAKFDFSYQFQNESSISASSSLSMTDNLELRGQQETTALFPHLGKRFVPKNVGYALVVSALADVFVTKLKRSGKMVGYDVRPVVGIPPDVNTITFLINPAYTMNGSLDGLTGSSAASQRFFRHVPEMRAQYGSLYPASYYRLKEAYDLKQQIEAEDKRRESYFSNFNVHLLDETSLDRNIDMGSAPVSITVGLETQDPDSQKTENEIINDKLDEINANTQPLETQSQEVLDEIEKKVKDSDEKAHASASFASWQHRMESLQIRAGKRNIVNTYVWDADGGLRAEAQSFASTVEHTIGGSFIMDFAAGVEFKGGIGGSMFELTTLATVNLTQTMNKTEARSKGFQLNVDLGGLEHKGITDANDRPIIPGEKVGRYRFMSFYLEGDTKHFHDFFNCVVDPEWLRSNSEEARALRQTQAGKPNKTWRVLHRVTSVERPALMGFGQDVRKLQPAPELSENQQLLDRLEDLEHQLKDLRNNLKDFGTLAQKGHEQIMAILLGLRSGDKD